MSIEATRRRQASLRLDTYFVPQFFSYDLGERQLIGAGVDREPLGPYSPVGEELRALVARTEAQNNGRPS
jgi:hypothetical protein